MKRRRINNQIRRDLVKTRLSSLQPVIIGCLILLSTAIFAAEVLPLKRITLFTSGVGFFQREGEVTGDTSVELSFRTEQINDLLKSMVLQDFGGGKIAPIVLGSPEPIERALKSFAIDITDNPSLAQLLDRMRGAKAQVAASKEIQGVIVGVETLRQKVKDEVVEARVLNLLTDQGLRAVPLDQVQEIKLMDGSLDGDLRNALKVLANSRDKQRKSVALSFTGQGKRRLSVGYILEMPVWRVSYRLELRDGKSPFLQGWAIVENTTDDDWQSVGLTLVSGRPISFIMDLYQPLYVPRPTVVPETFASLRPPIDEGAIESGRRPEMMLRKAATFREEARGFGGGGAGGALARTAGEPEKLAELGLADRGVSVLAEAGGVGELFQYAIDQPVTVALHKSAMLPIVNAPIEAEKVSIYNESVQRKFPLNGLRLTNTTGLALMQGPITVFDGGTYAGDARIEDLQPKEQRLISYALDLKVEVEPLAPGGTNELTAIQIRKGVLVSTRRYLQTKIYTIHSKAAEKSIVLVEHPFRADWKILEPSQPSERTPSVYRFEVAIDPGTSRKLEVKEEQLISESVGLVNADVNALLLYSRSRAISPKVRVALEKLVGMRNTLADLQRRREQVQQQINEITQEQTRIRDNMKVLQQTSELYNRYLKELDQQETQMEGIREQLRKLRADEETQRKQLDDSIAGLEVE
ncbi:MAG: hypothetical protein ABI651_03335 [Verrucomicrobiota bacterium]